ncbi:MAG: hypothetical protein M3R23_05215, partial [Actinomycetota bacterium]|nr:hypothetical protein [Actinomycetota bacterium]
DVAAPVGVDQVTAVGPLDDQRLLLAPVALLGEGMPEVVVVESLVLGRGVAPRHSHVRRRSRRIFVTGRHRRRQS